MKLKTQLLTAADAYMAATRRSETFLSRSALGRASALKSLRLGRDMLSGNVEAGLQWLSDHWPEEVAWPCEVPRPVPTPPPVDPAPAAEPSV